MDRGGVSSASGSVQNSVRDSEDVTAEKTARCSADIGVDVHVVQVVDWVSCWRCLKFSSSPEFVDLPVCTETRGFQRGFGGDVGFGIVRAPPGRPGVERQFSEPSMTKSSLPSRAAN